MSAKPFPTYFGGKAGSGTYQTIINQIPPHSIYIEPFIGNGAVFRYKRPADTSLLNDADVNVVNAWVNKGIARKNVIVQVRVGSQIFNSHAVSWMTENKSWFDNEDVFIYLDPPYPHDTRRSATRYTYEMDEADHKALLEILQSYHHAQIAISTYPNDLYAKLLDDWRLIEFQSTTRNGLATEWLLMNYPEPSVLHDYRYLGTDYRERERITRKVRRHVAKFQALPALERQALLSALNQL